MKNFLKGIIAVVVILVALACKQNLVVEQYQNIQDGNWNKDSVLVFTIPVQDTLRNYNFYINTRNDVNYQFSNLWLFVKIVQPDGNMREDKFEIALADPSGKWLGEGFGGLKTRETIYRRNIFFPVSGEYKVTIQQGMREDNLKGMRDVGIRIETIE